MSQARGTAGCVCHVPLEEAPYLEKLTGSGRPGGKRWRLVHLGSFGVVDLAGAQGMTFRVFRMNRFWGFLKRNHMGWVIGGSFPDSLLRTSE